jgi:hypothetical protein
MKRSDLRQMIREEIARAKRRGRVNEAIHYFNDIYIIARDENNRYIKDYLIPANSIDPDVGYESQWRQFFNKYKDVASAFDVFVRHDVPVRIERFYKEGGSWMIQDYRDEKPYRSPRRTKLR